MTDPAGHPVLGVIGIGASSEPQGGAPALDPARDHDTVLAGSEERSWTRGSPPRDEVANEGDQEGDREGWRVRSSWTPARGTPSSTARTRITVIWPTCYAVPPNVVVYSTDELEAAAETEWLARFDDQGFSLADAVSFAVMSQRGIREALTLDGHFNTAGFATLA